jgi:hypothetical protein
MTEAHNDTKTRPAITATATRKTRFIFMLKLSQNEPIGWHKAVSEPRQTQDKPKKNPRK